MGAPPPHGVAPVVLALAAFAACAAPRTRAPEEFREPAQPAPWIALFDGASLDGWGRTPFGGEGEIELVDGAARLDFGSPLTGLHWNGTAQLPCAALPRVDYELEVTAARLLGNDFFCGLTFPVGEEHATLVLGGWGGALTGLSCLDGRDASENETRSFRSYEKGRDYTVRVRVTAERVEAWLDGEALFAASIAGRAVSLRTEVLASRPLGFACYNTVARLRGVRLRASTPATAAPR